MKIAGYEVHPAAELFPILEGEELQALADDIKANGLLNPVALYVENRKRLVLDGRNRLKACEMVGIAPTTELWAGEGSPIDWIISQNLRRRHLDEAQRTAVGVGLIPLYAEQAKERQLSTLKKGDKRPDSANLRERDTGRATEKAAKAVNVSPRSIESGLKVQREAPELLEELKAGKLSVHGAVVLAKEDEETRRGAVKRIKKGDAKNAYQAVRQIAEEKRSATSLPESTDAIILPGDVREVLTAYTIQEPVSCVVMDPPYGLETHNTRRGGKDYKDGDQYALELLELVCERLEEILDPSAHLYVFSGYTYAHAFRKVLEEHFTVQDNPLIWVKDNHTMCDFSSWYPNKHEYIWFCKVKGSTRKLANCTPDVLPFPRERASTHSAEKPTALLRTLIENSTAPGELVLDPFVGSGATGVACVATKRRFIGIELEDQWIKVARSRIAAA